MATRSKKVGAYPGRQTAVSVTGSWTAPLVTEYEIVPPVDIFENEDNLLVEVELPGVAKEAIRLSVGPSEVVVEGTKLRVLAEEGVSFSRVEQSYGKFRRVIPLPRIVNTSRAQARLVNGILSITLPKVEERRGRKLKLNIE